MVISKNSPQRVITKTESIMVVVRGQGRRKNGELLFNRYRVSVLEDEKSYGDGWW